jgi:diaminopimelate decarboxylase
LLLPATYRVNGRGHMEVGGCDLLDLAAEFGTPLYVYDEETVRLRAGEYRAAGGDRALVLYSAKAFASPAFLRLIADAGLGLDVVSAGELHVALQAGFPAERIYFLGNNKGADELDYAHRSGCTVVIDGAYEFELLGRVVPAGARQRVLVRCSPGVKPDTHDFISTGQLDSKFGFPVETGLARAAVQKALAEPRLELVGLHSHIGSQIFDLRGHVAALQVMLDLAAQLRGQDGFTPQLLGAGGGLGIAYTEADDPPTPREFVETLLHALEAGCGARDLPLPTLMVEPGRSIAGPAGLALYTIGSVKEVPGIRTYAAVDGGMGDNIRPKLYGARYQAFLARAPQARPERAVTIAGKYCESTDILISDAQLPAFESGDVLCIPASGAYQMSMASNYNGMTRPAVVLVRDGAARVIRRRETLEDLLAAEVL